MNYWQGKKIRLRAFEPDDAETFHRWNLDSEAARVLDFVYPPVSLAGTKEWVSKIAKEEVKNDQYFFMTEDLDGTPVGTINAHTTDRRVGTFHYGLFVAAEQRRKGYAAEAVRALRPYAGGAPLIEADLEIDGRLWRLRKRYLADRSATLATTDGGEIYRGADAEEHLKRLLAPLLAVTGLKGTGKSAGPAFGLVWVGQRESLDAPIPHDETVGRLQAFVQSQVEDVLGGDRARADQHHRPILLSQLQRQIDQRLHSLGLQAAAAAGQRRGADLEDQRRTHGWATGRSGQVGASDPPGLATSTGGALP